MNDPSLRVLVRPTCMMVHGYGCDMHGAQSSSCVCHARQYAPVQRLSLHCMYKTAIIRRAGPRPTILILLTSALKRITAEQNLGLDG